MFAWIVALVLTTTWPVTNETQLYAAYSGARDGDTIEFENDVTCTTPNQGYNGTAALRNDFDITVQSDAGGSYDLDMGGLYYITHNGQTLIYRDLAMANSITSTSVMMLTSHVGEMSATLMDCVFSDGAVNGLQLFVSNGKPDLTATVYRCEFSDNGNDGVGGIVDDDTGDAQVLGTFYGCSFIGNADDGASPHAPGASGDIEFIIDGGSATNNADEQFVAASSGEGIATVTLRGGVYVEVPVGSTASGVYARDPGCILDIEDAVIVGVEGSVGSLVWAHSGGEITVGADVGFANLGTGPVFSVQGGSTLLSYTDNSDVLECNVIYD